MFATKERPTMGEDPSEKRRHGGGGDLEHDARLRVLGETAAALAHEIRNPLASMKLFLSLLKDDVSGNVGALDLVGHIETSLDNLNHVVTNVLSFSKNRLLTMGPVNTHAVVQEQIAVQSPRARGGAIVAALSGNPFIEANDHALRQVMANLIANALEATRFSGRIVVRVEDFEEWAVRMSVEDDGPGIPDEILDSLFEPFVTMRNEGTGLGLAVVKQVVEAHGGSVEASNRGGAVVTAILPRKRGRG